MSPTSFPDDIRHFIERHVDSLEELEILLHLHHDSPREATVATVAAALYTNPQSTGSKLRALHQKGLLDMRTNQGMPYFRLRATSPKARLVDRLAELYVERRLSVTDIIFSKPLPNIQAFADAFDFRKRDE